MRFSHTCHHMVSNLNRWPLSLAVQWTLKDSVFLLFSAHRSSLNLLMTFSSHLHLQMDPIAFFSLCVSYGHSLIRLTCFILAYSTHFKGKLRNYCTIDDFGLGLLSCPLFNRQLALVASHGCIQICVNVNILLHLMKFIFIWLLLTFDGQLAF